MEVQNDQEWEEVFQEAKSQDKIVFVDVYTDWCGYCHKLDKEVYTNQTVIDFFESQFINIKFDAETEFGYRKAAQYQVDGYPTLLFLTANEDVYQEIGGFVPSPTLMAYAKDVSRSWEALPALKDKYESGNITSEETIELIGVLEKRDIEQAATVAASYLNGLKKEDYLRIENLWLASRFENHLGSQTYDLITKSKQQIISTHGLSEYQDYMKAVYNDNLELAIRYGELKLVDQLIVEVLPEFVETAALPEMAYISKSLYYGQRNEFESYILENNAYINNHLLKENKLDWLVQKALEIVNNYESKQMYEHAVDLLEQAIIIDRDNFESYALSGYLYALLADFTNAEKYLNKAETLAGDNQEQKEIITGLKEAISVMKG